jgi:hypothetical protein
MVPEMSTAAGELVLKSSIVWVASRAGPANEPQRRVMTCRRRGEGLSSRTKLHIVCDNYGTRKHPGMQAWLTKNPRIMH